MIKARLFFLHFLQDIQSKLQPQIASDMHMDLIACIPIRPYVLFKYLRSAQPLTMVAIDVPRCLQLRELAEKCAIAKQLDMPTKMQTVAIAL